MDQLPPDTTEAGGEIVKWQRQRRDQERDRQRQEARAALHQTYEPPVYQPVILCELRIDERYQRVRSESKVNLLRARFHPNACQPLAVSKRADGSQYCVDGQHRAAVLEDIGLKSWPALVYSNLTPPEEAAMWEELNTRQTKPHPNARFKAALERGEPEAHAIQSVVTTSGLQINFLRGRSKTSGKQIDAIEAIMRIYRQQKAQGLADVLRLLQRAWPDPAELNRTQRIVLLGLAAFLGSSWNAALKGDRAAAVIGRFTPTVWIAKTRGANAGESPASQLCEKFRAAYNKGIPRRERL